MRIVIYDDDDMEPITVVNLRGVTMRDLQQRDMRWRIPVPQPITPYVMSDEEAANAMMQHIPIVELVFEPFRRTSRDGRRMESVMAFTKAADLAMLLNPDYLPGQRSAVRFLQDQNDGLTRLLMRAWS